MKRAIVLAAIFVSGCNPSTDVAPPAHIQAAVGRVGLSTAEQRTFYHLEEGSEVFPVEWFLALESESGPGRFADNLERFGFIPDAKSETNPYGLPVGMTAADTRDLKFAGIKMLGVNCAACHVGEVTTPQGTHVRLDGGPAHLDTSAFYRALASAVSLTVDWQNPGRFLAFVARLAAGSNNLARAIPPAPRMPRFAIERVAFVEQPPPAPPPPNDETLRRTKELMKSESQRAAIDISKTLALKNDAVGQAATSQFYDQLRGTRAAGNRRFGATPPGFNLLIAPSPSSDGVVTLLRLLRARLEFLVNLAGTHDPGGVPPGFGRLDAFGGARNLIWHDNKPATAPVSYPDLWSFDKLTWVHWDGNTTSVLERNIGQALGLGAVLDIDTLRSTVSVVNLHQLEVLAGKIRPPRWEDVFGPVDRAKAARGHVVFTRECAACHEAQVGELVPNDKLGGVDPNRADNFAAPINGQPNEKVVADLIGRIKRKAYEEKGFTAAEQLLLENGRTPAWRAPRQYTVPPLVAVWASAPYLHNNSVPTLRDLLTDPAQRPHVFYVGRTDYDTANVGFVSTDDGKGRTKIDTSIAGNHNTGHPFGTTLPTTDKNDLLEYLKLF